MPGKALIVDANILVRAVLGKRVREVIETYAEDVSFFVPEAAFSEAEEHLPVLVVRRGGDPERALAFLHALSSLMERIGSEVTVSLKLWPANDWATGIRRIGQFWPLHWRLAVQSGRKTPISSAAGLPRGRPIASSCF